MVTRGAWLLMAVLSVGCAGGSGERQMVSIPPPRGWEQDLVRERGVREQWIRGDRESPLPAEAREGFPGLEFWAPEPRYYFVGDVHAYAQPERFEIVTTSGNVRPCERIGWISFAMAGRPLRLQVYRLLDSPDPNDLFLPFKDETSGTETYPAGRYLELVGDGGGPWVLDFNRASNPSCAYGAPERFACPVTPAENRLPVRIEAGERGWKSPRSAALLMSGDGQDPGLGRARAGVAGAVLVVAAVAVVVARSPSGGLTNRLDLPAAVAGAVAPVVGYRLYLYRAERAAEAGGPRSALRGLERGTWSALAVTGVAALVGLAAYAAGGTWMVLLGVATHVLLAGALWPTAERLESFTKGGR